MTLKQYIKDNIQDFKQGLKDGSPIGLAYFAVSFSLGISASIAGINAIQGFVASLLTIASGQAAGFAVIAAKGTILEMFLVTFIASARYLLMSCALSQRLKPELSTQHRLGVGFFLTDEIFGLNISRPGYINPAYTYGAGISAALPWAIGTALGILLGNILPDNIVGALGVGIYGMFIAIVVPAAKNSRPLLKIVIASCIGSWLFDYLKLFSDVSTGNRMIIITILISAFAATFYPIEEEDQNE